MIPNTAHRDGAPIYAGAELVVERFGLPEHQCALPGGWRRRRLGLGSGAVVRCLQCGRRWQLASGGSWHQLPPPPKPGRPPVGPSGVSPSADGSR